MEISFSMKINKNCRNKKIKKSERSKIQNLKV